MIEKEENEEVSNRSQPRLPLIKQGTKLRSNDEHDRNHHQAGFKAHHHYELYTVLKIIYIALYYYIIIITTKSELLLVRTHCFVHFLKNT